MINSGVVIRNQVSELGSIFYDKASNDGILNTTPYALAVQAWATQAAPAWVETDRICRGIYKLIPPPSNTMLAAFGMPGVQPWRPSSPYFGAFTSAVAPQPSTGFNYIQTVFAGASGPTQPAFTTTLGASTTDNDLSWECIAAITGPSGGQPIPLPWDLSQATFVTMFSRATAASQAASFSPGLLSALTNQFNALTAILATQPAPNPTADAVSLEVTNALNVAIAEANAWIALATTQ